MKSMNLKVKEIQTNTLKMALTGSLTVVENLKIFHIEKRNGMSMTFMYFKPNYVQNSKWKNPIY